MYNLNQVNQLFDKLNNVTNLKNIAFHRIKNGALDPIHIMETEILSSDRWKEEHGKLHIKIEGDPVLERIVKGEIVYIHDIENDSRSSPAFLKFGIKTIIVFPLFNKEWNEVIGLIVVPSFEKRIEISDYVIDQCKSLIYYFNKSIY